MSDKSELMIQTLEHYGVRFNPNKNGWQSVRCPNEHGHVHGDQNPSARASIGAGGFFCHGCLMKGDAYSIVMTIENVDFPRAKELLGGAEVEVETDYLI
jgi:hypothetical protein